MMYKYKGASNYGDRTTLPRSALNTSRYNFIQPSLMAMPGWTFTVEKVYEEPEIPSVEEIHAFAKNAFVKTYLSSECSVVGCVSFFCFDGVSKFRKAEGVVRIGDSPYGMLLRPSRYGVRGKLIQGQKMVVGCFQRWLCL